MMLLVGLLTAAYSFENCCIFSLCAILFITDFQFVGLIFLPVATMFWADIEMRSAGFEPHQILLCLAAIAGLGIGLGEAIDILLIPSMRY